MAATPSEYRDYRRQSVGEADAPLQRKKSNASGRRGKDYEDLSKRDLEKEAEENRREPLGVHVGDRHVRGVEGHEEGYIGADNPFGSGSRGRRQEYDEKAGPFSDTTQGDIGQAYTSTEDDEGYYGGSRRDRPFSPSTKQTYVNSQYAPKQSRGGRQAPATLNYDPNDRSFAHPHEIPTYPTQTFYRRCFLTGFQLASWGITALSFNIIVVMALIWNGGQAFKRLLGRGPKQARVEKEWEQRISGERFSSRAEYYAEYFGYQCELLEVETEDGFVLRLHHLISKKHKQLGHPVILQHGILSNSVTFMVNEERSLAFWLVEQGYDVYLSNIRTNFKMPHRHFPRSDPRYWAWSIEQIAMYDLPAVVDFVMGRTGKKPAYIGHSQGTGTMFLALSRGMCPDLGNKISCFIALSPAVYCGPVLRSFPFSVMRRFKSRALWKLVFGCREFIPILGQFQALLPSWLFGHIGAPVFCFLFGFNTSQWLLRQIPKYFRTVGVPNSSELLYYYMSKFSYNNCIFDTETREPWFPASFPPLAIFYGLEDTLVLGRPLVERIRNNEPNVELAHVSAIDSYQHQDPIWGVNAHVEVFPDILKVLQATEGR